MELAVVTYMLPCLEENHDAMRTYLHVGVRPIGQIPRAAACSKTVSIVFPPRIDIKNIQQRVFSRKYNGSPFKVSELSEDSGCRCC